MLRGSTIYASGSLSTEVLEHRNNEVAKREASEMINLDFGNGKGSAANHPVTLPDIMSTWRTTGVHNIRTEVHLDGDTFPASDQSSITRSDGPSALGEGEGGLALSRRSCRHCKRWDDYSCRTAYSEWVYLYRIGAPRGGSNSAGWSSKPWLPNPGVTTTYYRR